MKYPLCWLLILILSSSNARAGWFSDDESKQCYDWYRNRESCSRTEARRESLIGVQINSYYGTQTNSMTGSLGQGLLLSTVKSKSHIRFLFGGQLLYAATDTYINDINYETSMLSGDLFFGLSIKPFQDTYLKPVFEISVLAGMKSIEFSNPPSGVEEKNLVPSYGGKISVGLDIPISKIYALRPAIDYQINRVDNVLEDNDLVLDALGFSFNLVFK